MFKCKWFAYQICMCLRQYNSLAVEKRIHQLTFNHLIFAMFCLSISLSILYPHSVSNDTGERFLFFCLLVFSDFFSSFLPRSLVNWKRDVSLFVAHPTTKQMQIAIIQWRWERENNGWVLCGYQIFEMWQNEWKRSRSTMKRNRIRNRIGIWMFIYSRDIITNARFTWLFTLNVISIHTPHNNRKTILNIYSFSLFAFSSALSLSLARCIYFVMSLENRLKTLCYDLIFSISLSLSHCIMLMALKLLSSFTLVEWKPKRQAYILFTLADFSSSFSLILDDTHTNTKHNSLYLSKCKLQSENPFRTE